MQFSCIAIYYTFGVYIMVFYNIYNNKIVGLFLRKEKKSCLFFATTTKTLVYSKAYCIENMKQKSPLKSCFLQQGLCAWQVGPSHKMMVYVTFYWSVIGPSKHWRFIIFLLYKIENYSKFYHYILSWLYPTWMFFWSFILTWSHQNGWLLDALKANSYFFFSFWLITWHMSSYK